MRRSTRRSTMGISLHQSLDNDTFTRVTTRRSSSIVPQFEDSRNVVGNFTTKFSMSSFVKKVEELTSDQQTAIQKVGFGYLLRIPHHTLRKNLLIELMERWDSGKKAFLLLDQELTITQMDVALILGLRVTGKPVTFNSEEQLCDIEKDYGATNGNRRINVSSIEKKLESLGDSAAEDFVRTFLLFSFATILFHNSTGKIDSRYLFLLQDLTEVADYAWGLAVVEDLFSCLSRKKEEGSKSMDGCLILLQIWSYEHIDIGRPNLLGGSSDFPRACRWESSRSNSPRHWFTTKFNELEENQVLWKLEPTKAEMNIDVIKELCLSSEKDGNDTFRLHTSSTTATTTTIGTSTQCKGLPPKAFSLLPPTDVNKKRVGDLGKHDTQAECPESSCVTDVSAVTIDFSECSSSYGLKEKLDDQKPETSHNYREENHVLKTENSELKKNNIKLKRENDMLTDRLSSNSKLEELIENLRKELADLKEENDRLRPAATFIDDLRSWLPETFLGSDDECLETQFETP